LVDDFGALTNVKYRVEHGFDPGQKRVAFRHDSRRRVGSASFGHDQREPGFLTLAMALSNFKSIRLPLAQVSLAVVLRCGQSFRWSILSAKDNPDSVEYRFCLKDRVICLRQSSDTLYYRAVFPDPQPSSVTLCNREKETLAWLEDYFQLDVDLVTLYQQWAARDKVFAKLQGRFEGIRILRQDPWENLVSYA
jgi:N-glycosylase/DNA lyase